MPMSVDQFVEQLSVSGVFSPEEAAQLRADQQPADAEQFARALVKAQKLTAYQAQQLYSGKGRGLVLGNYVILDKLGQGGMGMVLKARHKRMDRLVALKVLAPNVVKTPELLARFHREVKAAARLEHPNIVHAYDADEARGTHFFVMQYIEGSDLASLVKAKGPLPVDQAVNCIVQAARGLEFAHRQGVVHRDIKPANLLLDGSGTVKILDMGLARIEGETGEHTELTSTGAVMGTVDYMAPEQAMNTKDADARSDIYSLGAALWYLLVGRSVYSGDSMMARLLAHRDQPIPSLSGTRGEVPPALDAVFKKMVAKDPAQRYQSMTQVIAALEGVQKGSVEAAALSLIAGPSEDSKLEAFIGELTDPGESPAVQTKPATKAARRQQQATAPATINTLHSELGTSPSLPPLPRQRRKGADRKAAANLWQDPRLLGGGAAAVVLLGLLAIFWPSRRPVEPPAPPITEIVNPVATVARPAEVPAEKPTALPLPAGKKWGLRFTPNDAAIVENVPLLTSVVCTLELWVTMEGAPNSEFNLIQLPSWEKLKCRGDELWFYTYHAEAIKPAASLVGRRHHLAGVNDGQSRRIFLDGQLVAEERKPGALSPEATPGPLQIGERFQGTIDAVRVSTTARYTESFTPPAQFTPDDDTFALYDFTEGTGTVLHDRSRHRRDATIKGARWVRIDGGSVTNSAPSSIPATAIQLQAGGYIELPTLRRDTGGPYTVEGWVKSPQLRGVLVSLEGAASLQIQPQSDPQKQLWLYERSRVSNQKLEPEFVWGDAWRHVAMVIDDREAVAYLDGQPVGRIPAVALDQSAPQPEINSSVTMIGSQKFGDNQGYHSCAAAVAEFRFSNVARYQGPFTPATRHEPDPQTVALYHFDEPLGDVVRDASGHGHDGRLVNAVRINASTPNPFIPKPSASPWLEQLPWDNFQGYGGGPDLGGTEPFAGSLKDNFPGVQTTHGVILHALGEPDGTAQISFQLEGAPRTLTGRVHARKHRTKPLFAEILGDGRSLWKSPDLTTDHTQGFAFSVPVTGVRTLTLVNRSQVEQFAALGGWFDVQLAPLSADSAEQRAIAQWLIDRKFEVFVLADGMPVQAVHGQALPADMESLQKLWSAWSGERVPRSELEPFLERLTRLPQFIGGYLPIHESDLWAKAYARIPTIMEVNAVSSDLTDDGVAALARLPKLGYLNFDKCSRITSAACRSLHQTTSLHTVEFDADALRNGPITLADLQALQNALPRCRIQFAGSKKIPGLKPATAPAPKSADWRFTPPENLGPGVNNQFFTEYPQLMPDNRTLWFSGGGALWTATRPDSSSPFANRTQVAGSVNAPSAWDSEPSLSADGLILVFCSDRQTTDKDQNLWISTRSSVDVPFPAPTRLPEPINTSAWELTPALSADGLELYFASGRSEGRGNFDLYRAMRARRADDFANVENLGAQINTAATDTSPFLSADGLTLLFASDRRPATGMDLYLSRRPTTRVAFPQAQRLSDDINTPHMERGPSLSPDGQTLFFYSDRPGGLGKADIYQARLLPASPMN